jgi:integrase
VGRRGAWGEGTVYQRSDGRWVASWREHEGTKRVRRLRYARTEGEAGRLLREALHARERQEATPKALHTVKTWAEQWISRREGDDYSPSTLKRERELLRLHIVPAIGNIRIARLTPDDVDNMIRSSDRKLSARTRFHIHSVLRRCLGDAYRLGLCARNAGAVARAPHVSRKEIAFLRPEQLEQFFNGLRPAIDDQVITWQQAALFHVGADTGARLGELLALRWHDLRVVGGGTSTAYIARAVKLRDHIGPTKTGRGRVVPIPDSALVFLYTIDGAPRLPGSTVAPDALIFRRGTSNLPMHGGNVAEAIGRYQRYIGLVAGDKPLITFHGLRHTVATLLLASSVTQNGVVTPGLQPLEVAALLGHSSPGLLWSTYGHLLPLVDHRAARLLDSHLPNRFSGHELIGQGLPASWIEQD